MKEVTKKAKEFAKAEEAYEKAFNKFFANLEPLSDDRFWQLANVFRNLVFVDANSPFDEFFRKPQANQFNYWSKEITQGCPFYTFMEAMQFANMWDCMSHKLYKPLFDIINDRGDDAYGDLLDALPLAGREVFEKALNKKFANDEEFSRAVRRSVEHFDDKAKIILRGENYFAMKLQEEARRRFVYEATK